MRRELKGVVQACRAALTAMPAHRAFVAPDAGFGRAGARLPFRVAALAGPCASRGLASAPKQRERTFIMVKPDAVQRGLVGQIIT